MLRIRSAYSKNTMIVRYNQSPTPCVLNYLKNFDNLETGFTVQRCRWLVCQNDFLADEQTPRNRNAFFVPLKAEKVAIHLPSQTNRLESLNSQIMALSLRIIENISRVISTFWRAVKTQKIMLLKTYPTWRQILRITMSSLHHANHIQRYLIHPLGFSQSANRDKSVLFQNRKVPRINKFTWANFQIRALRTDCVKSPVP